LQVSGEPIPVGKVPPCIPQYLCSLHANPLS
jgi:hypothetical protein